MRNYATKVNALKIRFFVYITTLFLFLTLVKRLAQENKPLM